MRVRCLFCSGSVLELAATSCGKHFFCVLCLEKWRNQRPDLSSHFEVMGDELALGHALAKQDTCPTCSVPGKVKYLAVNLIPSELLDPSSDEEDDVLNRCGSPPLPHPISGHFTRSTNPSSVSFSLMSLPTNPRCGQAYTCQVCGDKFTTTAHKRMHYLDKHSKRMKCPNCAQTFARPYDLKRHMNKSCKKRTRIKFMKKQVCFLLKYSKNK